MSTSYPFTKGLHGLGNGCYGYLQPDGGWGYSNTGLIEDQGQCLLVDTLVDLPIDPQYAGRDAEGGPRG